jgi:hypothetical protein
MSPLKPAPIQGQRPVRRLDHPTGAPETDPPTPAAPAASGSDRLADPSSPAAPREAQTPLRVAPGSVAASTSSPTVVQDEIGTHRRTRRPTSEALAPALESSESTGGNPYLHAGRPIQVAMSLYLPMWELIEEQCRALKERRVRGVSQTAWMGALLHFRSPRAPGQEEQQLRDLLRRWRLLEADDADPYSQELRKEPRAVRIYEPLWQSCVRAVARVDDRATMAMFTCAMVEFHAPREIDEARALMRDWRLLLA